MNDTVILKDIAEIRGRVGWKGYTVEDLVDEGPLVVGANDITTDNQLDLSNVKHLTRKKYEESPEIFIKKNDILVVKVGSTIGKVCIIDQDIGESSINPNCVIVRPNSIDPYYLYCYLCSPAGKAYLLNNSSASGQPALNQKDLGGMPIPIIGIGEQIRIAKIIHNINKKIRNNNKIVSKIDEISKSIYDYWFLQFEFPNEDGKPYKSSGGKMVWNDELKREIPEGWKVKSYSKLGKLLMGQSPKSDSYNNEGIGYPLINGAAELREDSVAISKYTSNPTRVSQIGDLLFCIRATISNLQFGQAEYCLGRGVASYRPNSKKHIEYLYFVTNDILAVYNKILTGSIIVGISKDDLLQQPILTPNESIINAFSETVHPMFETIANLKKENQELASLRDFLLPMLMNGQVTFKEDE